MEIKTNCGCHSCNSDDTKHEHEENEFKEPVFIIGIISLVLAITLRMYIGNNGTADQLVSVNIFLFAIAYLSIGKEVLLTAFSNIRRGEIFDENFLMTIASFGAFCIGEYPEAVAVMLFYRVGEHMQELAVKRSKKSISDLMDIRPDTANLKLPSGMITVPAEAVGVGDKIIVRTGESIPLDGIVIEGSSTLDMKVLTGESVPVDVGVGTQVLSGSINGEGLLTIEVNKSFHDSTASRILDLVESASEKKARTENFITKFARVYTPIVCGLAVLLAVVPPLILNMGTFSDWLGRALVFLVVSCPCALVISIPLSYFGGIGASSSRGILVKGGNCLEALKQVDTIVFDKTGTLTTGKFVVSKVVTANGFSAEDVVELAALAEESSTHPIAVSIKEQNASNGRSLQLPVSNVRERAGFGVKAEIDGRKVVVGNARIMAEIGHEAPGEETPGTKVYVSVDDVYAGMIVIEDQIKPDAKAAIEALRKGGVKEIHMLTGDSLQVAESVGTALGISEVHPELLPQDKVEALEAIIARKAGTSSKVAFVGDGINDAPVLARSDIGIAMGGAGSDAAIEAADIVLMTDELSKIAQAIRLAKATSRVVWQNIIFSLGVKALVLILATLGMANMWQAVFADVGVAIIAVLNAVRIK
jgi:Zn2+/Cd2+-exporting ATPase